MQGSIHNVQVRFLSQDPIIELLRSDAALAMFDYGVLPSPQGWVGVYPQRIDKGLKVAKTLSLKLHTDAFFLRTFTREVFTYAYFRNGEKHDEYSSSPELQRQLTDMDDELGAIVLAWEQGELSSQEYREKVDAYLAHFDARVARLKEQARSAGAGQPFERHVEAVLALVFEEFRGRDAQKLAHECICELWPSRIADAERILQMQSHREPASGGDPRKYQHLVSVAAAQAALGSRKDAEAILADFASALKMPNAGNSFQQLAERPVPGLKNVGPSV